MKTFVNTYQILLLLFLSNFMMAQSHNIVPGKESQLSFFLSQITATTNIKNISTSNSIYIQQIGNYNQIKSNTRSKNSDINLFQVGNNNKINLDLVAINID